MSDARDVEWRKLYNALRTVVRRFGEESPYGDGDFWLVEHDWGGYSQKLCIFRVRLLSQELVEAVQELLRSSFPNWSVLCQFEVVGATEKVPPEGIVIFGGHVVEHWDKALLRRILGSAFQW